MDKTLRLYFSLDILTQLSGDTWAYFQNAILKVNSICRNTLFLNQAKKWKHKFIFGANMNFGNVTMKSNGKLLKKVEL